MPANRNENLDLLMDAYHSLVKAGRGSLRAAYAFGQVCDALNRIGYTQTVLAEAVGLSNATISRYMKLFRRYANENMLLRRAEELGTYDVGQLAGNSPQEPAVYVLHCIHCGTYNEVVRERKTPEEAAALAAVTQAEVTA
jgi:hypothetical protein